MPISPNCVFDASLVPGTCLGRFLDLKGLINKFLESRLLGMGCSSSFLTFPFLLIKVHFIALLDPNSESGAQPL